MSLKKNLNNLLEKINKESIDNIYDLILDLKFYIPEFTNDILLQILPKLLQILQTESLSGKLQTIIINTLSLMIKKKIQNKPETIPFNLLIKSPKLLNSLFLSVKNYESDIYFILLELFLYQPPFFEQFICNSPKSLIPLLETIEIHQNINAARLLQRFTSSNEKILSSLIPLIIPKFRKFPVTIVLDYLFTNNELKKIIPLNEVDEWLLNHNSFTIDDIEVSFNFFPHLWDENSSLFLFSKSTPSNQISKLNWLRLKKPQKIIPLQEQIDICINSILKPQYNFSDNLDEQSSFFFTRFYVLSLSNPNLIPIDFHKIIYNKILDPHPFTSAAATQISILWSFFENYKVPSYVIYFLAGEAVNSKRDNNLKTLYKLALLSLAPHHLVIGSILSTETDLLYLENHKIYLNYKKVNWIFPHLNEKIPIISKYNFIDYSYSLTFLGKINKELNIC